jgi:hypothetical protein
MAKTRKPGESADDGDEEAVAHSTTAQAVSEQTSLGSSASYGALEAVIPGVEEDPDDVPEWSRLLEKATELSNQYDEQRQTTIFTTVFGKNTSTLTAVSGVIVFLSLVAIIVIAATTEVFNPSTSSTSSPVSSPVTSWRARTTSCFLCTATVIHH